MGRVLALIACLCAGICLLSVPGAGSAHGPGVLLGSAPDAGCVQCHQGIEAMHPEADLSCVDCHGGDGQATTQARAHVRPKRKPAGDERVAGLTDDLAWRRFVNPMDLRVADQTCGACHADLVGHLATSLHGTTAGHLSDGYYEVGATETRGSQFGIFPVPKGSAEPGDIESLGQVPEFEPARKEQGDLAHHFRDLARKECAQCHLYSQGRAVRGRVGFDGDYRGEGCAACHVPYALHGFSESADATIRKNEPGHPRMHRMTAAPSTQTCTSCHYGDASIGLHFRGLSQLPPGAAAGPDVPGTTDSLLNRTFYLNDPALCPPDIHHERGMHCIDCHTLSDVMGDGRLYGAMEHAVEITCAACHGTFSEPSRLETERGTPLEHLSREGERVIMRSKVTGALHKVTQVAHVVDPEHEEYNERAAQAMTPEHADLACYTCHAGWNANFLGFHFDRNEGLTQLDLLSGEKTPGRVTTQEKVFSTWTHFYAGLDPRGQIAPYLTGFSTMGSVTNAEGEKVLDQVMPVTAEGLSGMTMVHHQLHSTRETARQCVECHRSSATWGLGSGEFRLARRVAFVADRRGIEVVALDRTNLAASVPLTKFVQPDVIDLELVCDPLQGHAQVLYASEGGRGVHVLDVSEPANPRRVGFLAMVSPRGLEVSGEHLFVADGRAGLRVFDISDPTKPELVGGLPSFDAHEVVVQWPMAYLADGVGGVAILDVRRPAFPKVVGALRPNLGREGQDPILDVAFLFQYSRPQANARGEATRRRTQARALLAFVGETEGLFVADVTEPSAPELLYPRVGGKTRARSKRLYRSLLLSSHVDLSTPQGGRRTEENQYAYVLSEVEVGDQEIRNRLTLYDVTDADSVTRVSERPSGYTGEDLTEVAVYNRPFLRHLMFVSGEQGVLMNDVGISAEPSQVGALPWITHCYAVAVEEFPLDRMRSASGELLKDTSHIGARWLELSEIERILGVSGEALGTFRPGESPPEAFGQTARLEFMDRDADASGLLGVDEAQGLDVEALDQDADGRISLLEFARHSGLLKDDSTSVEGSAFRSGRSDPEGDLARLLDGLDPFAFDRDRDDKLTPKELEAAFYAALDLDGDERLSAAEYSRQPGPARGVRFQDATAVALFKLVDRNKNGFLSPREYSLRDADWQALDLDGNGTVLLGSDQPDWMRAIGWAHPNGEWPSRRDERTLLPPDATLERVLEAFDRDANRTLSRREMRERPSLFGFLDMNGDERVEPREISVRADRTQKLGVDGAQDGLLERWDLDGDGVLGPQELGASARRLLP